MSDPVAPPPVPTPETKPPSKFRQLGIKVAVVLGIALIAFIIGWFVGHGPVGELREQAGHAESSLALMQDHLHMTEAVSLLYRTALDLDARNFGTANDRLDETASVLQSVGAAGSGLDSLRQAVSSTDINVAQDLAGQRTAVLGFADVLQSLMASVDQGHSQDAEIGE